VRSSDAEPVWYVLYWGQMPLKQAVVNAGPKNEILRSRGVHERVPAANTTNHNLRRRTSLLLRPSACWQKGSMKEKDGALRQVVCNGHVGQPTRASPKSCSEGRIQVKGFFSSSSALRELGGSLDTLQQLQVRATGVATRARGTSGRDTSAPDLKNAFRPYRKFQTRLYRVGATQSELPCESKHVSQVNPRAPEAARGEEIDGKTYPETRPSRPSRHDDNPNTPPPKHLHQKLSLMCMLPPSGNRSPAPVCKTHPPLDVEGLPDRSQKLEWYPSSPSRARTSKS
jgi:hypothetical protein